MFGSKSTKSKSQICIPLFARTEQEASISISPLVGSSNIISANLHVKVRGRQSPAITHLGYYEYNESGQLELRKDLGSNEGSPW